MSTRSHIGILNPDSTVDYIYCHFNGYLAHNGVILKNHYNTEEKVRKLIELGDLSILEEEIGEKQDFNKYPREHKNWCLAYGRDRGEEDTEAQKISYINYTKDRLEDYTYLFTPGKGWEYRMYGDNKWEKI